MDLEIILTNVSDSQKVRNSWDLCCDFHTPYIQLNRMYRYSTNYVQVLDAFYILYAML